MRLGRNDTGIWQVMVVIDASVAVKVVVPERFSDQAKALVLSWDVQGIKPVAPDFMATEFSNALHKKIRAEELTSERARQLVSELYESGIAFRPSRLVHGRAIDSAEELSQRNAYDCHYLALAESRNCDFWTADQPFYRAARGFYSRVRWIGSY